MRKINLQTQYDLIVVGAGIQGCAMFWEAQSRGMNTLLIDANDYCSQTSANSMKTIHGGIRYLQTLNLARTWRSCKEPETLLRIASHLVHPLPFLLPTQKSLKRSRLAVSVGFTFYNQLKKLAFPQAVLPNARFVSKSQLDDYIPGLSQYNLTGAGLWYDAQVQHSERLGLAFVKTALHHGGEAFNYLKAESISKTQNGTYEIRLTDQISQQPHLTKAKSVIFSTAVDTVENLSGYEINNTQFPEFCLAMNVVVNKRYYDVAFGLPSGFARQNPDSSGRLLFSAPWQDSTLFGTWYFDAGAQTQTPLKASDEQIMFCLDDINKTYPGLNISKKDVGIVHAGLLPMENRQDKSADPQLKEQDLIIKVDESAKLLAVIPSKYTTCRAIAEKVIDQLSEYTDKKLSASISASTALTGSNLGADFERFILDCQNKYQSLFSIPVIRQLATNYGEEIEDLAQMCLENNSLSELIPGTADHIKAQIDFAVNQEQAQTLNDILKRRTGLYSGQVLSEDTIQYISDSMKN